MIHLGYGYPHDLICRICGYITQPVRNLQGSVKCDMIVSNALRTEMLLFLKLVIERLNDLRCKC